MTSPDPEPERRPPASPPPLEKPSRSATRLRDLVMALGALLLIVLVMGGVTRSCSFAPGGPTVDQNGLPTVDGPAELRALAAGVGFPVRIPALPADWRANSTGKAIVGAGPARSVRVGYVTAAGHYLQLVQSDAPEEALIATVKGTQPVAGQGTVAVGRQTWVVYDRRPAEPVWVAEVAGARLLITGSGTDDEFRTLAEAVLSGPPAR